MKFLVAVLGLFLVMMIASCGGGPPGWYGDPPNDPDHLYEATSARSQDRQMAVDKARHAAEQGIARQLEVKVEGLTERFRDETGEAEESEYLELFKSTGKTVVSTTLRGTRVDKQHVIEKDGTYEAYLLMELSWGEAQADMLEKIRENKRLYTRFQATKAFDELEKEVAEYEEYKKERGY